MRKLFWHAIITKCWCYIVCILNHRGFTWCWHVYKEVMVLCVCPDQGAGPTLPVSFQPTMAGQFNWLHQLYMVNLCPSFPFYTLFKTSQLPWWVKERMQSTGHWGLGWQSCRRSHTLMELACALARKLLKHGLIGKAWCRAHLSTASGNSKCQCWFLITCCIPALRCRLHVEF